MSKKDKGDLALEAAYATGALIGFGLSFTALSPLVIRWYYWFFIYRNVFYISSTFVRCGNS